MLIDQPPDAGGLECTDVTSEGFIFDMGGHLGVGDDAWNTLQRALYVWLKKRWIPYPCQNNIAALDEEDKIACLAVMVEALAQSKSATSKPVNFDVHSGLELPTFSCGPTASRFEHILPLGDKWL